MVGAPRSAMRPLSDLDTCSRHFQALNALVTQLRARGLSLYAHSYDRFAYGSWLIVSGTEDRRVRVTWDGKHGTLRLAIRDASGNDAQPHWRALTAPEVPRGSDEVTLMNTAADLIIAHHNPTHPTKDRKSDEYRPGVAA